MKAIAVDITNDQDLKLYKKWSEANFPPMPEFAVKIGKTLHETNLSISRALQKQSPKEYGIYPERN